MAYSDLLHYYGFKAHEIDDLTLAQVDMYLDNIPRIEYRRAYPVAAMMAHAANLGGGKPRRPPKKDYTKTAYQPEEFLSWFAQYEPYLELSGVRSSLGVDAETAKLVVQLNTTKADGSKGSRLEPWVVAAIGDVWGEVVRAAGG